MNIGKGPTTLRTYGRKSTVETSAVEETTAGEMVTVPHIIEVTEDVVVHENPVNENVSIMIRKDKCRHGGTGDLQGTNSKMPRSTTDDDSKVDTSLVGAHSKLSPKDSLLTISEVMRNVASNLDDFVPREELEKSKKEVERLRKAKDKALRASKEDHERLRAAFVKLDAANKELEFQKANGALSPKYPTLVVDRLMKTNAFYEFFVNTSPGKNIGVSEGLKGYRESMVVGAEFPSIEDLDKTIVEDSEKATAAFISSIRTGGYDFPFVTHL